MIDEQPHYYETDVEWTGEHKGEVHAPGLPPLSIATPPEFEGHEGVWTPEHLYVAAANTCLMTTFLAIAELSKLDFIAFRSQAQGKLEKVEGRGYQITEIVLKPHLTIARERDRERAIRILEKAKKHCLISNSMQTVVKMESVIFVNESLNTAA